MVDYSTLKVVELKEELKKRGLPVYGLKKVLVERLETATEQEDDEEGVEEDEEEAESGIDETTTPRSTPPNHILNLYQAQNPKPLTLHSKSTPKPNTTHTLAPLELLAEEIFTLILSHVKTPAELANICQTSSHLCARVSPVLYSKFEYRGLRRERKRLRRFWLTVLWKPDLAASVKELDVGEWGKCPRLEDWIGVHDGEARVHDSEGSIPDIWDQSDGGSDEGDEDAHDDEPFDSQEESISTIERGGTDDDNTSDEGDDDDRIRGTGMEDVHDEAAFQKAHRKEQKKWEATKAKWAKKKEQAEFKALMAQPMPSYFKISKSDDEDEDFEPSDSGDGSDSFASGEESEFEGEEDGFLVGPEDKERYADVYEALRAESKMLGFADVDALASFHKESWDPDAEMEDEDVLCQMLPLLKNLKTMHLMPIDLEWGPFPLREMVEKSHEEGETKVLEKLEKLYICSSLHIGSKEHREYDLQLHQFAPYLRLPSLHTLALLTPSSPWDEKDDSNPDLSLSLDKSTIKSLTLDESELSTTDTFALLAACKSLTHLRWSQDISCSGGCGPPFHNLILSALEKHAPSLTDLDLDLRHRYCSSRAHLGNPDTTMESLQALYSAADAANMKVALRDSVLIGSLRGFSVLRMLAIDVTALCGHQRWIASPTAMVELLPPNLHTLHLRVMMKPASSAAAGSDNELWSAQVLDLLKRKEDFLPALKVLGVKVCFNSDRHDQRKSFSEDKAVERLWKELRDECQRVGVMFELEDEEWGTKIPWFKEKSAVRNPGRDW
ncbi:hypothetical protein VTL71DRAFT_10064 [Oculimacula yallundae]|uniref:SAP domain-containing protein n=1 Tax=Oculimacula yallundae TaxID=86028 RepID=A0ABR4BQ89_9HELO